MSTTLDKVSFTFGTEESVTEVCSRIMGAGDAGVLWGTLNATDAQTFRAAAESKPGLDGLFHMGGFRLDNEETAELFSALIDFGADETSCDVGMVEDVHGSVLDVEDMEDGDVHTAEGFCDCDMRNRAWSWASDIAEMVGVELI